MPAINATTAKATKHGEPHWSVTLPEGVPVQIIPATNLPPDSPIKWWLHHLGADSGLDDSTRRNIGQARRAIGVGLWHEDIVLDPYKLDDFTRAYIECALWSSTDNSDDSGGDPLDSNYTIDDIEPTTLAAMVHDCAVFQERYRHLWEGCQTEWEDYNMDQSAGHDYWLTRNGHGAGFWGRHEVYGRENAERLSNACRHQTVDLYVTDSGTIAAV